MTGWRLYAGMLGGAALVGALVALLLSGGFGSLGGVARVSPSGSPPATIVPRSASPTVRSTPSPSPSEVPSPSPSGTPDLTDLVRPERSVRPIAGTTLLLPMTAGLDGTTFVAIPVSAVSPRPSGSPRPSPTGPSSAPATLGTVGPSAGYALRADGVLLAVALVTGPDASRIALWDLRTGSVEWLSPDEPDIKNVTPVWSADGSLLYYASSYYASSQGTTDLGVWRIRVDGTQRTLVRRPVSGGSAVTLVGLTPDGAGLSYSYVRAGGSANVLDLRTGTDRAFDDTTAAAVLAWREARPRALVSVGGGAARPPGTLTLWDDIAGTKKVLLGPDKAGSPDGVGAADFDPTGTRIAVAAYSKIRELESRALDLIDLNGTGRTVITGTEAAEQLLWFRAGIVFTRKSASGGTDVLLIPPTGGTPVTLYSAPGAIGTLTFVSP